MQADHLSAVTVGLTTLLEIWLVLTSSCYNVTWRTAIGLYTLYIQSSIVPLSRRPSLSVVRQKTSLSVVRQKTTNDFIFIKLLRHLIPSKSKLMVVWTVDVLYVRFSLGLSIVTGDFHTPYSTAVGHRLLLPYKVGLICVRFTVKPLHVGLYWHVNVIKVLLNVSQFTVPMSSPVYHGDHS